MHDNPKDPEHRYSTVELCCMHNKEHMQPEAQGRLLTSMAKTKARNTRGINAGGREGWRQAGRQAGRQAEREPMIASRKFSTSRKMAIK